MAEDDSDENWNKSQDLDPFSRTPSAATNSLSRAPSGATGLGKGAGGRVGGGLFSRAGSGSTNMTEAKMNWKIAGHALKGGVFSRAGSNQSAALGGAGGTGGGRTEGEGEPKKKEKTDEGVLKEVHTHTHTHTHLEQDRCFGSSTGTSYCRMCSLTIECVLLQVPGTGQVFRQLYWYLLL